MKKLLSLAAALWRQRTEICEFVLIVVTSVLTGALKRIKAGSTKYIFTFKAYLSRLPQRIKTLDWDCRPGLKQVLVKLMVRCRPAFSRMYLSNPLQRLAPKAAGRLRAAFRAVIPAYQALSRSNAFLAACLGAILFASGFGLMFLTGPRVVVVNGVPLAVVENQAVFQDALEKAVAAKSQSLNGIAVEVTSQVELKMSLRSDVSSGDELVEILASGLDYSAVVTAIAINGQPRVILANAEDAQLVLDQLKEKYLARYHEGKIINLGFEESVELVPVRVSTPEVLSPDQALEQIMVGEAQAVEYTIKEGDSLWEIARRNNLKVSDLLLVNPGLNEDRLQLGQVIRLMGPTPLINVVATVETLTNLPIPFSTEVKADNEKWRGYKKVIQAGVPGSKDVAMQLVYRNGQVVEEKVLSETVVQNPQNQIEVRGTRILVASRSDQGIGKLGWPIRGQITSYYGKRGREFHSGIDIDGVTGQLILAAEDGTVIEAQWNGSYGREVVIDHGGGLLTRYAHCSSIDVKRGDRVSRGEVIARVGSTGRSTGSHLHFEVIVHGSTVNPLNFLR